MIIREHVPLATLTTLKVGGTARYVLVCESEDDIREALSFAISHNLPWQSLGEGSNVLAADEGYEGVILQIQIPGITYEDIGAATIVTAGAGVHWDTFVADVAVHGLWGVENLAGIPGTVGAAPVQNIGAYGTEVKDTLLEVRVLNTRTGLIETLSNDACAFEYRESVFKKNREYIILSVSFSLTKNGEPSLGYADLRTLIEQGKELSTPQAIGAAVRKVRARKFPDLTTYGTAGSFFKNPILTEEHYASLKERYEGLPGYSTTTGVKIPLAFVLDHILNLRGHRDGSVWLFTNQPLVLVADKGATTSSIDTFANAICARVYEETKISVEREVQKFPYTQ